MWQSEITFWISFEFQVVLNAGDILYIPQHWWHHVRSFDCPNIAISLWFHPFKQTEDDDELLTGEEDDVRKRILYQLTIYLPYMSPLVKPGSHMPLSYLPVLLGHSSNMRTEVASNRGHVSLYCRHAVEVDSSSTSQACSAGKYLRFFLLPGGLCLHIAGSTSRYFSSI